MSGWLAQAVPSPPVGTPPDVWSMEFALDLLPLLLKGLLLTVELTVVGTVIAMTLGLVLALARRSPRRWVGWPTAAVIEFIRSTPLLPQLFFVYFALPTFGIRLGAFTAGSVMLGIHFATYASEAYRAGIDSVPKGQWEAAVSVNLSRADTWRSVVLPQAIPTVIPSLGNYVVAMFKDAPLVALIGVLELVGTARRVQAVTFRGLEPYLMAGLLFLAVSIPAALVVRYLERRYVYERS